MKKKGEKPVIVNLRDFEDEAQTKLTRNAKNYYFAGANDEITLGENIEKFNQIKMHPRVLVNVQDVDLKTRVLGEQINFPIAIAPTAMHQLCHPQGQLNTARAAKNLKTIYTMSTLSTTKMTDLMKDCRDSNLNWFQLYITKDRIITEAVVRNAENLGFKAIVLTVDAPILGRREIDEREKFALPSKMKLEILAEFLQNKAEVKNDEGSGLMKLFGEQIDPSIDWRDVKWLQNFTSLPLVLKGIQRAEDADIAAELGCHIWVSNHGGRQLDTVRATIEMLPEIVQAAQNRVQVYVDGGVRKGVDVFKCLALGAKCVFLGRPVLFANTCDGQTGIENMLKLLSTQLKSAMQLSGVTKISHINSSYIIYKPKL